MVSVLYTVNKLQVCDKLLLTYVSFCLPSFSSALVADSKACFWVVAASSLRMDCNSALAATAWFWSCSKEGALLIASSAALSRKRRCLEIW
jgi:hypothetical protein